MLAGLRRNPSRPRPGNKTKQNQWNGCRRYTPRILEVLRALPASGSQRRPERRQFRIDSTHPATTFRECKGQSPRRESRVTQVASDPWVSQHYWSHVLSPCLIMGSYFKARGDDQPQTLRNGPVDEVLGPYALHPANSPTMQVWPEGLRKTKENERFYL